MSSALLSHRCQHCAREFSRAEHLVRHERIHTKEKPFACGSCNQAFSRRDLLRRHEKKVHTSPSRVVTEASEHMNSSGSYDHVPVSFLQSQSVNLDMSTTNPLQVTGASQIRIHGWTPHVDGSPGEFLTMNVDSIDDVGSQNWFLPNDDFWSEQFGDNVSSMLDMNGDCPERHEIHNTNSERGSLLSRPGSPPMIDLPRDIAYSPSSTNSTSDFRITHERYILVHEELQPHTISHLPSRERLSQFIYRYFESFHRHQPFLHPATWSPQTAETSLILAICACGALYSLEAEVAMELNKAAICCMSIERRELSTLQAYMISTAFSAWSGQRDDIRDALRGYGDITLSVREIWSQRPQISTPVTFSNWSQWIEIESLKRVTFCLFTLMNLMTISYDIPAPLMLEKKFGLPCHESQWHAGSEEEWEMAIATTEPTHTMTASDIIDQLCTENTPVPQQVGIFGCHVIISSLVQRIILFRKANLQQDMNFYRTQQKFYHTLRRWQRMWENEPKEGLSPNSQYGPMLFNSTALLRFAYVRLASDYSPVRSQFSWCDSVDTIVKSISSMELPPRNHISTRAALHACLALKIPARLGFRLVARTSFWVWSVQHALCYFECALLLGMWLEKIARDPTEISDEEADVIDLIQQVIGNPNPRNHPDHFREMKASVFRVWGQLLDTGDTTVWALIPKLAQVLSACAVQIHTSENN